MTDKEKFIAEIEKVKFIIQSNRAQGAFQNAYLVGQESVLEHFDRFVKSIQEEPISEDLEEASKEWLRPQLDKSYANYGEKKMMELTRFDGYAMLDAIEFGTKLQKQQLMTKAFDFTKEHNTACVLASECLRNHGWFNRERDFNNLWRHLSCVDELFEGKFSGKTKVIVIKEE